MVVLDSCILLTAKDDPFYLCFAFNLSKSLNGSVDLEAKNMATKPGVSRSNPRHCKQFLKQRSEPASEFLWSKRQFTKN